MGCCFGGAEIAPSQRDGQFVTPFENRKCRDVFWLLGFLLFWGGMLFVAGWAFLNGNTAKLLYGTDSMGNVCGAVNTFNGTEYDLRGAKKLYWLDPFEIAGLDVNSMIFAKSVCLPECPKAEDLCPWDSHFDGTAICDGASQFRCPYYASQTQRVAELGHFDLYPDLPTLKGTKDVPLELQASYYAELAGTSQTTCPTGEPDGLGMAGDAWQAVRGATGASASEACGEVFQHMSKIPNTGPCYPVFSKTVDYLNRCIPDSSSLIDSVFKHVSDPNGTVAKTLDEPVAVLQRYASDLNKGIGIPLLCGLALGCFLSLFWMIVLRYFAGIMAWFAVVLLNLLFAAGCVLCFQKAGLLGQAGVVGEYITEAWQAANLPEELDPATKDKQVWTVVAWISLVLFALVFLFTLVMIRRIKIAVACLKVASQAVASMPSIMVFPFLPFICVVLLLAYWITVAALLYTVGEVQRVPRSVVAMYEIPGVDGVDVGASTGGLSADEVAAMSDMECYHHPECAFQTRWGSMTVYMGLYHLFGLLWTMQFILGYGYVVLAAAVGHFYWYRGDSSLMPRFPVLRSMRLATIYHLGSVALGSLIVAIIQFVRILLNYLDHKTKRLQDTSVLLKWCMCCVKCCMWYLEKVVKYINRNAYILVGVKGTSYCASAGRAVGLIISNVLRLAAVNVIGDFLIFIGKLCVVGGCGVVAFFFADIEYYTNPDKHPQTYLSSPVAPIILTVIIAYICASVFFQVYEMAVDTVLLCFCDDCDMHGDPKFAPPLLMSAIGLAQEAKAQKAAARGVEGQGLLHSHNQQQMQIAAGAEQSPQATRTVFVKPQLTVG